MTLGDADFSKSPMKMIYRKLSKTAAHLQIGPEPLVNGNTTWFGVLQPCSLRGSAFLGIENTTNVLVTDGSAGTNIANPGAVGWYRRELFFIN